MSERHFRLVCGFSLWIILVIATIYQYQSPMYAFMGLLLFEGITNWRVPVVVSRLRYGKNYRMPHEKDDDSGKFYFLEAERVLRFVVVLFLLVTYILYYDLFWFFPWFVAGMLIMAGITNICPMAMFLKWMGFK